MRCRRFAFSLVELLVVVAIILVLLSILQPTMRRAIEAAHRAICASNLHQAFVANAAWASDRMGHLVEGQPAYDKFKDDTAHPGQFGNMGQYAVWNRQWNNPSKKAEYGGKYAKHGALVSRGYLPDARTFYCPSWSVPWIQYGVSGKAWGNPGGGWFEDLDDLPGVQDWMQTSYHYNSQFGSPDYTDIGPKCRGARLSYDPGSSALMADAFSDPARGVDLHHRDGYSVLHLGGYVDYHHDPDAQVRDLAGGQAYHANGSVAGAYQVHQARAWRLFEDRP